MNRIKLKHEQRHFEIWRGKHQADTCTPSFLIQWDSQMRRGPEISATSPQLVLQLHDTALFKQNWRAICLQLKRSFIRLKEALIKCSERSKFESRSAPVRLYSEHHRFKIWPRSNLIRASLSLTVGTLQVAPRSSNRPNLFGKWFSCFVKQFNAAEQHLSNKGLHIFNEMRVNCSV